MYIQRFDRVLFCFIFIVLASNYSLKPPRFYGNKGIILNQWTAKYGACPINPEEQVLFIPIVPLNAEIAPIDKSFQDWPRQERTAPWLCLMEGWCFCDARRRGGRRCQGGVGPRRMKGQGGMLVGREGCWYPGSAADRHALPRCLPGVHWERPGGMLGAEGSPPRVHPGTGPSHPLSRPGAECRVGAGCRCPAW